MWIFLPSWPPSVAIALSHPLSGRRSHRGRDGGGMGWRMRQASPNRPFFS